MRILDSVRRAGIYGGGVLLLFPAWYAIDHFCGISQSSLAATSQQAGQPAIALAAPGRTEALSETVNVAGGIDGVLFAVLVDEGQQVKAGQVIAVIDRRELPAELGQARAAAAVAREAKVRLLRGSRDEQRREVSADVVRASAAVEQAKSHYNRQARLLETDDVPRAAVERARSELEMTEAAMRAAVEREKLVNAPPLPEDLARADAEIESAEQRVRTVQATIDKCSVRAPIAGTVVRRHMKAGEVVSTVFPQPIVSIADTSHLRVRAEVDERDLSRVHAGQPVLVSADAFGVRTLTGRVTTIGSLMGRKRVRTGDPAEKSDRDVLEVLVDLDATDAQLVLGLRVTVQFLDSNSKIQPVSQQRPVIIRHSIPESPTQAKGS